ncbi:MAG: glycoside hydrolase family 31 protein [Salinivirgaceae bacterium]|nr:glycoside hydrolase family 31 protein [Salinivirgaceae bacterium]
MKKLILGAATLAIVISIAISCAFHKPSGYQINLPDGVLNVSFLSDNSARVKYIPKGDVLQLPDYYYVTDATITPKVSETSEQIILSVGQMKVLFNKKTQLLSFADANGNVVLNELSRSAKLYNLKEVPTFSISQKFDSPADEFISGTGQFQDGWLNVRGLARRLTQVNTQIAVPMILSNRGYGLLWNNYGLTEYNQCANQTTLQSLVVDNNGYTVDATSTHGNSRETRYKSVFQTVINVSADAEYRLLIDVGQAMARKHLLMVDGDTIVNQQNLWLPPTSSTIVKLSAGEHSIQFEGTRGDNPILHWDLVENSTSFASPTASAVDYTVFVGSADKVIASYRNATGNSPMLPRWMYGYIHCRERYQSSDDILQNAREFRRRNIPIDVIVQDWQWWGKYGWNAMQFDEDHYPDPKALTDTLHNMDMRLMLSVWSKIDANCEVGQQAVANKYYVDGTDWIDFMNPAAADFYWKNFSQRLVPTGVDSWWQDATEPENDDLVNRRVMNDSLPGEFFRNIYTLFVNKTVFNGLASDQPDQRSSILTRSGCVGIQRYGSVTWSGDVNNDWVSFRNQIIGGLGQMSSGLPWWTYDAGGFFRPRDQYNSPDYAERLSRWVQTSVFLPFMRMHGYMSNTEPWNFGEQTEANIVKQINLRYKLLPYIYSNVARVTTQGYTIMRPLIFDFANDAEALSQQTEFMFGDAILVSPITEGGVSEWKTYLPKTEGWYSLHTNELFKGGQSVLTKVESDKIPVFVKAGSIVPMCATELQNTTTINDVPLEVKVYTQADASFVYYEDDGLSTEYVNGNFATIEFKWNQKTQKLTIGTRKGEFKGMTNTRPIKVTFVLPEETKSVDVVYYGKKIEVSAD